MFKVCWFGEIFWQIGCLTSDVRAWGRENMIGFAWLVDDNDGDDDDDDGDCDNDDAVDDDCMRDTAVPAPCFEIVQSRHRTAHGGHPPPQLHHHCCHHQNHHHHHHHHREKDHNHFALCYFLNYQWWLWLNQYCLDDNGCHYRLTFSIFAMYVVFRILSKMKFRRKLSIWRASKSSVWAIIFVELSRHHCLRNIFQQKRDPQFNNCLFLKPTASIWDLKYPVKDQSHPLVDSVFW